MKTKAEIKLEWQKHNRDNGLSWNEVAELVNQVYALSEPSNVTEEEIEQAAFGRSAFITGVRWLQSQESAQEIKSINEMIHCIKQSAIAVKETPDTRWLLEILLKNAEDIKVFGGGIIPDEDITFLEEEITPEAVASQMQENIKEKLCYLQQELNGKN